MLNHGGCEHTCSVKKLRITFLIQHDPVQISRVALFLLTESSGKSGDRRLGWSRIVKDKMRAFVDE